MGLPLAQVVEWWLGGAAGGSRLRPPVAGSHWLSTVCAAKLRVVPGAWLNLLSREDVGSVGLGKLLLKVHLFPKSCFNQQLKIYVILVYNQTIEV